MSYWHRPLRGPVCNPCSHRFGGNGFVGIWTGLRAMWYVGQKIVCKDNDWLSECPPIYPIIGQVYTIRYIFESSDAIDPEATFWLEEIKQVWLEKKKMVFWRQRHFRPVELKGMQTLRALLKPVKEKA